MAIMDSQEPITFLLASQSPRRRELIGLLNYPFQVMAADADEDSITTPDPAVNVVETAVLKSTLITAQYTPPPHTRAFLIAADTTVAVDGERLNKPGDTADAWRMLQRLRNRPHEVHSGFVLLDMASGQQVTGVHTAVVTMRNYSDAEIEAYIATGDPLDKAGAYAIQHPAFRPVSELVGCYLSVMGLPLCDILLVLRQWEIPLPVDWTAVSQAHDDFPCTAFDEVMRT
jgi:septum formation protein